MTSQPALTRFSNLEAVYPQTANARAVPAELAPAVRELAASFEKIEMALRRLMASR